MSDVNLQVTAAVIFWVSLFAYHLWLSRSTKGMILGSGPVVWIIFIFVVCPILLIVVMIPGMIIISILYGQFDIHNIGATFEQTKISEYYCQNLVAGLVFWLIAFNVFKAIGPRD